jgi:hypothetical protein
MWDKKGTIRAGNYNFFYGKGNKNHELGTGFFRTPQNSVNQEESIVFLVKGCHI